MQASKINLNTFYAIRTDDGLKRFCPSAVITRRVSSHKNPRNYSSTVEGHIMRDDLPGQHASSLITLPPDKLLGEWTEFKELTERAEAEKATKKAKEEAVRAMREELAALLREIGQIDDPAERTRYSSSSGTLIRASYGSVDISDAVIPQLLDALTRLRGGLTTRESAKLDEVMS